MGADEDPQLCTFRPRVIFRPDLAIELCYALAALGRKGESGSSTAPCAEQSLPTSVARLASDTLATPFLWTLLPDVLLARGRHGDAADLVSTLRALPNLALQEELIRGIFHEPEIVRALLLDRIDVREAIARASDSKREWLAYVGLFPYLSDSAATRVVELILERPETFVEGIASVLHAFWDTSFSSTWTHMQSSYLASINLKRTIYETVNLQEFFDSVNVRISVDVRQAQLKAMRGSYAIGFDDIHELVLVPSAFNTERSWTVVERDNKKYVFCPYYDDSLFATFEGDSHFGQPRADVALTLRALGDTTRFAIAGLLAQHPQTSTDLAHALAVSKPTVSHHIRLMREAALIIQRNDGKLLLRRDTIERLSDLLVESLYHFDGTTPTVQRSRKPG